MLKNLFLVAIRNLRRNKLYSLINILGLSLGLAVFILISLILLDDLTYDRFHEDKSNTYRLVTNNKSSGKVDGITSGALIKECAATLPEIKTIGRVHQFGTVALTFFGADESEAGIQRRIVGADSNFFKIFPAFKLLEGDPDHQLIDPNTGVITRDVARALFGDENPIGQVVRQDENDENGFTITGIISDCPRNSHLQYDIIASALINEQNAVWWESWDNIAVYGYLRTQDGADPRELEAKMLEVGLNKGLNEQYIPTLQPLLDIHLGSTEIGFDGINYGKSDRSQVLVLGIIAVLTLLIASINFINLSSARAIKRAREVGMRKVVGANRNQLMGQFLGESVLLTLIAMIIAAVVVQLVLPALSNFINKEIAFTLLNTPLLIVVLLVAAVVIGLLAGVYPALILAGFKPISVLKGAFRSSAQGVAIRRILVVIQFAISISLIACVIIVLQQLDYIRNRNLGFNVDQTLMTFTFNQNIAPHRATFMEEILKIPTVEAAGTTNSMLGQNVYARYEGRGEDSMTGENSISFCRMVIGHTFIPAMKIELINGRNFELASGDDGQSVILNETAIHELGWEDDPIGKRIILLEPTGEEIPHTVIGVAKDFQFSDARTKIDPMMMEYDPNGGGFVAFRVSGGAVEESIEKVREVWESMFPDNDFFYQFLDERIDRMYNNDKNFATKIGVFSLLAIIIASLGLLGLTSYTTEQRRREIAVRKVLGGSEGNIIMLLTTDFLRWVMLANLIAWPVAYYAMGKWLDEFEFRMALNLSPFLIAGFAALVIAVITVSGLAWRASRTNPAEVLHQE